MISCCGGGGLIAGTSLAVTSQMPGAQIWAAEPEGFDDTIRSLESGEILSVDPCNEEAFRILMIDAAASRNAARLKQVYQRCETELRHELNVAISAETRTLYEGLMRSITN